ncbi:MAG TPA: Fur family transcriptional regulator [Gammaproteobacteria bacterium]|nr:Fur family transcriptional regulator [Gammaproteobacteria bacterium]
MIPDSADLRSGLRRAGLRATRPRLELAGLIFGSGDRHLTAESLEREARAAGIAVPLATVYNTLNCLTDAGLLREIVVDAKRTYFDTNTAPHYHFFYEDDGRLEDIPADSVAIGGLPEAPSGTRIRDIDLIIRVRNAS